MLVIKHDTVVNATYMAVFFLVFALGATRDVAESQPDTFDGYSIEVLRRMVYVRGLSCKDCTEAEYRSMARNNAVRGPNSSCMECIGVPTMGFHLLSTRQGKVHHL